MLTVNGGDGRIVEMTPGGTQVAHRFLDRSGTPPGYGALFGLTVAGGTVASTTSTTLPTHSGCCTNPNNLEPPQPNRRLCRDRRERRAGVTG